MAELANFEPEHENTTPLFSMGHLGMTPGALSALLSFGLNPNAYLTRHVTGDWREMDAEDQETNRRALRVGARVFSAYQFGDNKKLWVITEADRSSTLILLPSEY